MRNPHRELDLRRSAVVVVSLFFVTTLTACRSANSVVTTGSSGSLSLSTTSFQNGRIPGQCTCDGADKSPQLAWNAPPKETKSFALILTDPDSPGGTFTHWVIYNIPPGRRDLSKGEPQQDRLEDGSRQGRNDFGNTGYSGPCPPHNSEHRYVFSLYALDTILDLSPSVSGGQLHAAIQSHILARGQLTARYAR